MSSGQYRGAYEFTRDYFTSNIKVWSGILAPFVGQPDLRYLEVGVSEGRSALWMLENVLTHPTAFAVCVDPFRDSYGAEGRFYANLKKSGCANRVEVLKGYSQIVLRTLPLESFDIVYVDGGHRAPDVLEDGVLSYRLLKLGGVLIFDDYHWQPTRAAMERPAAAIDVFRQFFASQLEVLHGDYQVVFRRTQQGDELP